MATSDQMRSALSSLSKAPQPSPVAQTGGALSLADLARPQSQAEAQIPQVQRDLLNAMPMQHRIYLGLGAKGDGEGIESIQDAQRRNAQGIQQYYQGLSPEQQWLTSTRTAHEKTGGGNIDALMNEMNAMLGQGINFGTQSGSAAQQIRRMAPDLARYGVTSFNDLKPYTIPSPTGKGTIDVFYNTRTNTLVPVDFGSSMKGEGGSNYTLKNINGRVVPVATWRDTSEAKEYAPLAMAAGLAMGPALGGLASSLGGSLASATGLSSGLATGIAQAGLSGLGQGALSAAMGGNFGQGFLGGALGSGITSGIGSLGIGDKVAGFIDPSDAALKSAISGGVNSALAKGLSGAAISGLMGGDPMRAGLAGALSGALSGGVGNYLQGMGADPALAGFAGSQLGKLGSSFLSSPSSRPSTPVATGAAPGNSAFGHSMGPLGMIAQARRDIGGSGLGAPQQNSLFGGLNRLENRGRSQWGWTT